LYLKYLYLYPQKNKFMTTITIKINEKSAEGKGFLKILNALSYDNIVQIVQPTLEEYDPKFVSKIKESRNEIKSGKSKSIKTKDLWK